MSTFDKTPADLDFVRLYSGSSSFLSRSHPHHCTQIAKELKNQGINDLFVVTGDQRKYSSVSKTFFFCTFAYRIEHRIGKRQVKMFSVEAFHPLSRSGLYLGGAIFPDPERIEDALRKVDQVKFSPDSVALSSLTCRTAMNRQQMRECMCICTGSHRLTGAGRAVPDRAGEFPPAEVGGLEERDSSPWRPSGTVYPICNLSLSLSL
jgi:hypothetical protein